MNDQNTIRGSCFCGEVQVEVTGQPEGMGYCHCESCRHWSAGPGNAFSLWNPDAVKVTQGADSLGSYQKSPVSIRHWCKECGGHVYSEHPTLGLTDVYAAIIADFAFDPGVRVNYQEAMLPIRDGLPKMKDCPAELGGSGEQVPE